MPTTLVASTAAASSLGRGGGPLKVSTAAEVPRRLIADQPGSVFLPRLYEVGVRALKANDLPAQWFAVLHVAERVVQAGACDGQRNPGCEGAAL